MSGGDGAWRESRQAGRGRWCLDEGQALLKEVSWKRGHLGLWQSGAVLGCMQTSGPAGLSGVVGPVCRVPSHQHFGALSWPCSSPCSLCSPFLESFVCRPLLRFSPLGGLTRFRPHLNLDPGPPTASVPGLAVSPRWCSSCRLCSVDQAQSSSHGQDQPASASCSSLSPRSAVVWHVFHTHLSTLGLGLLRNLGRSPSHLSRACPLCRANPEPHPPPSRMRSKLCSRLPVL